MRSLCRVLLAAKISFNTIVSCSPLSSLFSLLPRLPILMLPRSPISLLLQSPINVCTDSVDSVRDVLGRWGKKVGEATKKADDHAGNSWQHYNFHFFYYLCFYILSLFVCMCLFLL